MTRVVFQQPKIDIQIILGYDRSIDSTVLSLIEPLRQKSKESGDGPLSETRHDHAPFAGGFLVEIASGGEIVQETLLRARAAIEQEMVSLGHLGKLGAEAPHIWQATRFLVQFLRKEVKGESAMTTRREFIRQIGTLLASLTATHCTPALERDSSAHDRLRRCWLSLNRLEKQAQEDYERGQEISDQVQTDHRAALDDLVEAGELDAVVAEHVQAIFDEGLYHIWSSLGTCYESVPWPDYLPAARGQLIQQTELLAEMAAEGDLDPQTVAQAQAALERDVAFLNLSEADRKVLYDELTAGTTYPPFGELDLEITSPAVEATRFMVQVLLQE